MTEIVHNSLCAIHGFTGQCSCGADPDSFFHRGPRLHSAIRLLLPDELFGEVMQGMVDSHWLRERAETIAAAGGPDANSKAAALFEAADAAETISGSPDAAP